MHEDRKKYPRVMEIPFSSERKRMTTVHRMPDGRFLAVTKGAPDLLFPHCVSGASPRQNEADGLERRSACWALRTAVWMFLPATPEDAEEDMTFAGLIGMTDPPRPEAAEAVATCKKAGIRPVMITGDHAATAAAVAMQLGHRAKRPAKS